MKANEIFPDYNREEFLISQLRKGNIDSYEFLFHRYYPTYFRFARGMLKEERAAEDIMQNVFMKIWQHRERLDETMSLKNYIYVLSKREILNYFRTKYYNSVVLTDEVANLINPYEEDHDSDLYHEELRLKVQQIFDQLPPRQRQIFFLSRFKYLSNKEISEQLKISIRTVEKHIQLAIRTFREQLGDMFMLIAFLVPPLFH